MATCLIKKNPKVAADLDELTAALGSEDAAYASLSYNNGYSFDFNSDGSLNIEFSKLVKALDGNRNEALKIYALISQSKRQIDIQSSNESYGVDKLLATGKNTFTIAETLDSVKSFVTEETKDLHEMLSGLNANTECVFREFTPEFLKNFGINEFGDFVINGLYDPVTDTVYLNTAALKGYDGLRQSEVIMHELIHSRTLYSIFRVLNDFPTATLLEKAVYNAANQLLEHYRDLFKDEVGTYGDFYGLTDLNEFVSEIFTNPRFLEKLNESAINLFLKNASFIDKAIYLIKLFINKFIQLFDLSKYNDLLLTQIKDLIFQLMTEDHSTPVTALSVKNQVADYNRMKDNLNKTIAFSKSEKQNLLQLELLLNELDKIQNKITEAYNERIKLYRNPDRKVEESSRREMEYLVKNITLHLQSDIKNIVDFLIQINHELLNIQNVIDESNRTGLIISSENLSNLRLTFFDLYDDIFKDLFISLTRVSAYEDLLNSKEYALSDNNFTFEKLKNHFNEIQNRYNTLEAILDTKLKDTAIAVIKSVCINAGLPAEQVEALQLALFEGVEQKDISYVTQIALSMDKVNNVVTKSIVSLITEADMNARKKHFARVHKFLKLVRAAGKYNLLKLFEVDNNGNKTGYLVRSRNYGKLLKNFEDACNLICTDLGIDRAELNLPENNNVRLEFNRRRNEWLSKHTERRMTKEYYDLFNSLSEETRIQRLEILTKINTIIDRYRDEFGMPHLEKMTKEEERQYKNLRIELRKLASIYTTHGELKGEGSVERLVADELTELNRVLAEGLDTKKNVESWKAAREKAKKELSPKEFRRWDLANSIERIDKEFYDELSKIEKKLYGKYYVKIAERIRGILNIFRDPITGEVDLDALHNSKGTIGILNELYDAQAEIRMQKRREGKLSIENEGSSRFEDIAEVVPTERWYEDYKEYYLNLMQSATSEEEQYGTPESAEMWLNANAFVTTYVDSETGLPVRKVTPKAWYTKLLPKNKSLIHIEPNNFWGELSEDSSFINKEFLRLLKEDPSLKDEYWIPKKEVIENGKVVERYDNTENWLRILSNKALKALYDAIVEEIKESTNGMSNIQHAEPYRIPARAGSFWTYFIAGFKRNGVIGILKAMRDYFIDKIGTRANDTEGLFTQSKVKAIPQYYLGSLYDPAYTANDLVESVLMFADSCTKWKEKTKVLPQIEVLREYLKNHVSFKESKLSKKKNAGQASNLYKMADDYINRNLYDNTMTNFLTKVRNVDVNWTKMLGILKVVGTTLNLGLNVMCASRGLVTAAWAHMINAFVGRYYNPVDAVNAFFRIQWDMLSNAGRVLGFSNYETTTSKFMQEFGIGAELEYDMQLYPKVLRSLWKHKFFGPYTMFDHYVKGQILLSVMNNFRLITDENGNKTFMCREDYLQKYGRTKTFSKAYFNVMRDLIFDDKPSFYSCVEYVGGELTAKDPELLGLVEQYAKIIGLTAQKLSQEADGQLTLLQRPLYLGNVFGSLIGMHRLYMPVIIQNRWASARQYDCQMHRERESMFITLFYSLPHKILNESLILTSTKLDRFKKAGQILGKEFHDDPVVRENIKKFAIEASLLLVLNVICVPLLQDWADRDKDNLLKLMIAMTLEGSIFEIGVQYNPFDLYSLVKSVSAISNLLESYGSLLSFIPQFYEIKLENERLRKNLEDSLKYAEENGHYNTAAEIRKELEEKPHKKIIKTGAYAGKTRLQRSLIKVTPFHNIYELYKAAYNKRKAYELYVMGNAKIYN